jgi:hypothetical protein
MKSICRSDLPHYFVGDDADKTLSIRALVAVPQIVALRSNLQMVRVYASLVVALMAHNRAGRNIAVV